MDRSQASPPTPIGLIISQGTLILLTLLIAAFWPRAGQATALLPVSSVRASDSLNWALREGAPLQSIETNGVVVVTNLPSTESAWRALKSGFLPIAAEPGLCSATPENEVVSNG